MRDSGNRRLGGWERDCVSTGEPIFLGTDPRRQVGRGARALSLVRAAAPPGYARQIRTVHQTGRAGMRPWLRVGARSSVVFGWRRTETGAARYSSRNQNQAEAAIEEAG